MQFSYKSFAWGGGGETWVVAVAFIAKRPACLRIKTNQTRWESFRSLQQIFDNFVSLLNANTIIWIYITFRLAFNTSLSFSFTVA